MTAPTTQALIAKYGQPDDLAEGSESTNIDRVEWAWIAAQAFMAETGQNYTRADFEDPESGCAIEVIGDLICDLMHLATMCGTTETAEDVITAGVSHFEAEVGMGYDE